MKQHINILLKNRKILEQSILVIPKFLLNTLMIWMIKKTNVFYKNIEEYNPNKKHKILPVFDDRIADILSSTNLNPIIIELFIRVRKLNFSFEFITQSYFAVLNNIIGLFSTQYMKILLWKFQTNKNFNELHLIIHQILTLKTYESLQKMYWMFLMLLMHQIIPQVSERIF